MNEREYTEQMLEGGKTLAYLNHRFLSKQTAEQLNWLLSCLRDSELLVPILPETGQPDLLESDDGIKFLPVFSQPEQMPADYRERFELKTMDFGACLALARSIEEVQAIVLDGLTEPMTINYHLGDAIMRRPSRLHPAGE